MESLVSLHSAEIVYDKPRAHFMSFPVRQWFGDSGNLRIEPHPSYYN